MIGFLNPVDHISRCGVPVFSYFLFDGCRQHLNLWKGSFSAHMACSHFLKSKLWNPSQRRTEPINHPLVTLERHIWRFEIGVKCQVEFSHAATCTASLPTAPLISDISSGYDLRVLRRLGVPAGHAGARWGEHRILGSHVHAAREGGAARGPEQLLQHSIRQEPREAPTERPAQVCACVCVHACVPNTSYIFFKTLIKALNRTLWVFLIIYNPTDWGVSGHGYILVHFYLDNWSILKLDLLALFSLFPCWLVLWLACVGHYMYIMYARCLYSFLWRRQSAPSKRRSKAELALT